MKKAALRRRRRLTGYITEVETPQPFFNYDIVGIAWGSTSCGAPVLIFALDCSPEAAHGYVHALQGVTLHVIHHDCYIALVAVRDGVSLGRLTTSLGSPLGLVVDQLKSLGADELNVCVMGLGGDHIAPFPLPLIVQEDVVEDFEPIEFGAGGFVCFSMNVHTGVAYAHRFQDEQAAREQRTRNVAEDRPFVGLQAN